MSATLSDLPNELLYKIIVYILYNNPTKKQYQACQLLSPQFHQFILSHQQPLFSLMYEQITQQQAIRLETLFLTHFKELVENKATYLMFAGKNRIRPGESFSSKPFIEQEKKYRSTLKSKKITSLPLEQRQQLSQAIIDDSKPNSRTHFFGGKYHISMAVEFCAFSYLQALLQKNLEVDPDSAPYLAEEILSNILLADNIVLLKWFYEEKWPELITDSLPLGMAAKRGALSCVKYLIEVEQADINAYSNEGYTALHEVVRGDGGEMGYSNKQHHEVVKYLIAHGADLEARNRRSDHLPGETAYEMTKWCKKKSVFDLRIKYSYTADEVRPVLAKHYEQPNNTSCVLC